MPIEILTTTSDELVEDDLMSFHIRHQLIKAALETNPER